MLRTSIPLLYDSAVAESEGRVPVIGVKRAGGQASSKQKLNEA